MRVIHLSVLIFFFTSCNKILLTNVNLVDTESGNISANTNLLIKKEKIEAIAEPSKKIGGRLFSKKIDCSGKWVIPGLIDAHAHLIFLLDSLNVKAESVMPLYFANGVTSVRDIGDGIAEQQRVAKLAMKKPETYPTVYMCSPLMEGQYAYHGPDPVSQPINDSTRVPGYIDSLVKAGISTIKIYAFADAPVYRRIIEEGHKHGITVAAHLPSNRVKTSDALSWGIDVIEHIFGVPTDSVTISEMARRGVMVDPTLVNFRNMFLFSDQPSIYQSPAIRFMPDTVQHDWELYRKNALWLNKPLTPGTLAERESWMIKFKENVLRLHKAGIKLLAGTDAPEPFCPPGFTLHEELELLVESGLTPIDALACATINVATALKQEKNIGSVRVGKFADLVILNADPTVSIKNTKNIHTVIHRGKICNIKKLLSIPRSRSYQESF